MFMRFSRGYARILQGRGLLVFFLYAFSNTGWAFPDVIDLSQADGNFAFELTGAEETEVAGIGDINNDGVDDFSVGGFYRTQDGSRVYSTFVVFGNANGFPANVSLAALDGSNGFRMDGTGTRISAAGDVNGDGVDDFMVVSPSDLNITAYGVYVVFGHAGAYPAVLDLNTMNGSNGFRMESETGMSLITPAGDINGDGYDDLLLLSYNYNPRGVVYGVYGRAGGFPATLDLSTLDGSNGFRAEGFDDVDNLGSCGGGIGDFNGDGIGDWMVGTNINQGQTGVVFVVFGRNGGYGSTLDLSALDGSNGFKMLGESSSAWLGKTCDGLGDMNGDGLTDIALGAPNENYFEGKYGATYVIFGRATGWGATFDLADLDGSNGFRLDGEVAAQGIIMKVYGIGDLNGDGLAELSVSTEFSLTQAYVIYGRSDPYPAHWDLSGVSGSVGFIVLDRHPSLDRAGDVDGDGVNDLILGGSSLGNDPSAYVLYGQNEDRVFADSFESP